MDKHIDYSNVSSWIYPHIHIHVHMKHITALFLSLIFKAFSCSNNWVLGPKAYSQKTAYLDIGKESAFE